MSEAADDRIADAVLAGDRRALARSITLIESTRGDDQARAQALLARLLPETGGSARVGVSGAPGVGKSTFIEAFGLHLIEHGHRVAVLAVDPSSKRGGGALLGDKTRMAELAKSEGAFIRPSPAGATLGGVARRTREAMLACEAAGFDVVLVETVGVGQSETAVADMVDTFLLLLAPGGGDELQGLKKGIVELADLIVVNKSDGALADAAARMQADYRAALGLVRPASAEWTPQVLACSALHGHGVAEVWRAVEDHRAALVPSGGTGRRRARQSRGWMWSEIGDGLVAAFKAHPQVAALAARLEDEVAEGALTPHAAAMRLLEAFRGGDSA
ncbi:MAG: methylmalonyl Co-A mutase-associated GTPase MeaB [Proteobacteria bacterium]|nr:methylmalonyl Co-A mutase-associated GTPase MeaB [Pseudomonadota bacterium]